MADYARFFLPRPVEMQMLDEADQIRTEARAYTEQATPELAARVGQLTRDYPGARPGVLMAAAQGGLSDDEVRDLVEKDYQAQTQDRGWLGRIGDIASDLANTAGRFIGSVASTGYDQAVKPAARAVTTVAEGLFDEIIQRPMIAADQAEGNLLTNPGAFAEAYRDTGASVLGQSVASIARGERPDLGTGFFAGGQIREDAHANDLEMQIGGKSANFGRVLTKNTISNLPIVGDYVKPGSQAFDVVSGVAQIGGELALDPFAHTVKGVNLANKARKTLSSADAADILRTAGAVENGANSTVLIERAEKFLGRKDIVRKLTQTNDFDEIWKGSKKKLTPEQALALAESTDDATTARILLEEVAHGRVRERGFYSGFGKIKQAKDQIRLTKQMPGSNLHLSDSRDAVSQLDDLMATVKLSPELRSKHNAALTRALRDGGDTDAVWDVMRGVGHDMGVRLEEVYGIDKNAVKELVDFSRQFASEMRVYAHDALGEPFYFPGAKTKVDQLTGIERVLPTAHALAEYSDNLVALPDARELRKAAQKWSVMRKVYQSKGWNATTAGMNKMMQVWKPLAYVRPAYLFRVPFGEEQVRIWADSDQMVKSPMALMRHIVRDPKKAKDLLGDDLGDIENFKHAMASGATEQIMDRRYRAGAGKGWTTIDQNSDNFAKAWQAELRQIASDPVHRGVLAADDPYEWFWSGGGQEFREQLARGTNHAKKAYVDDDVARTIKKAPNSDETFASAREAADAYVDSVRQRVRELTGGMDGSTPHPDLVDAIRNGNVDDLDLSRYLEDAAPRRVKSPVDESAWLEQDNRWFDQVFEAIVIQPTNRVARSQAYRGYQGQAWVDLMDATTPAVRRQMLKAAKETGQDKAVIKAMQKRIDDLGDKSGLIDDIADINEMAHFRAADQTKHLLYDMTRRGHFADATRLIFPFAEAWVEMVSTWGRLLPRRPDVLRKAQIVMDNGESMGFFEDNDFGDKVFNYPGGSRLYEWAEEGGGRAQMEGRLSGLNLLATGVGPGFGPLVQWPVSALATDYPDLEWFRQAVAPFGSEFSKAEDLLDAGKIINEFAPAWARKVLNGISKGTFGREEDYHRTVGDVASILAESGKFEPGDPELMKEAAREGRWVHIVRGFAQAILPTGPDVSFEVQDPTGKWLTLRNLAEAWKEIRTEAESDVEALKIFDQRYGMEPWFVGSSKSQTVRHRPVTEGGDEWLRRNPDLVEKFPNVAGMIAPEGGDFSYEAWKRSFDTEDRSAYTPEQRIALASSQKAWMIYNRQQELAQSLPKGTREAYLSDVTMDLEEDYPGWREGVAGLRETASRDQKIAELRLAVQHPSVAETETGEATRIFLERYDEAAEVMKRRDPSAKKFGAKRDADLIQYLQAVGSDLVADKPSFHGIWTYIFEPELS